MPATPCESRAGALQSPLASVDSPVNTPLESAVGSRPANQPLQRQLLVHLFPHIGGRIQDRQLHLVLKIAQENCLPVHHRDDPVKRNALLRALTFVASCAQQQTPRQASQPRKLLASPRAQIRRESSAVSPSECLPQAEKEVEVRRLAHMLVGVNI